MAAAKRKLVDGEGLSTGTKNELVQDAGAVAQKKKKKKKGTPAAELGETTGLDVKQGNGLTDNHTTSNEKEVSQSVNADSDKTSKVEASADQTSKKKKKKKKKNKAAVATSGEKRKLVDGEGLSTGTKNKLVQDTGVVAHKKKKKKGTPAAELGETTGLDVKQGNGLTDNHTTSNENEVSQSVNADSDKTSKVEASADQTSKKKKKKKKKNKAAVATSGGSGSLTCSLSDSQPFSSLQGVSEETMKAIAGMGFTKMTAIQSKAIPLLLKGKDVRGTAKTGSGKTLAFIIPTVERLHNLKFTPAHGPGAIIISPTRELSIQTFNVLEKVIKGHSLTSAIIMGGVNQAKEVEMLAKGINVLVATPGRLLSHLQKTDLVINHLACLIIDEADRILDVGFEEEMNKIIEILPKNKQTMFFSATRDKKVNLLARLSLNGEPMEVEGDSVAKTATVDGLEQAYVVCHTEKKFLILHNFLEKNRKKKVMVFFTTCNAVKFYHGLLNLVGFKVMHIHGKQKQEKRTATFYEFCKSDSAILLCTDVAARGWDIPAVDWIVQYDPPEEPKEYIHRVGRTARAGGNGKALLFIREEERGLLDYLKHHKVHVNCEDITWNKNTDLQLRVEKIVKNNTGLKVLATVALMSYLRAYIDTPHTDIYNIKKLDLRKLCKCLGLENPPPLPKKLQTEVDEILPAAPAKRSKKRSKYKKNSSSMRNINGKSPFQRKDASKTSSFKRRPGGPGKDSFKMRDGPGKKSFQKRSSSGNGVLKGKHTFKTNKVFKAKDKMTMKSQKKEKLGWHPKSKKNVAAT